MELSLSFVIRSFFLQSHFPKPRESETENETISCDIWVCYCGTIVPFSLEREREKDKTNLCRSWFIFLVISNLCMGKFRLSWKWTRVELFKKKRPRGIVKYDEIFLFTFISVDPTEIKDKVRKFKRKNDTRNTLVLLPICLDWKKNILFTVSVNGNIYIDVSFFGWSLFCVSLLVFSFSLSFAFRSISRFPNNSYSGLIHSRFL